MKESIKIGVASAICLVTAWAILRTGTIAVANLIGAAVEIVTRGA